jgi:uncharacterized secreted protein with C-terminal beta-propeller domain
MPRLGAVGGLGAGERIYAVRFIGETGYVVTFRQVDPLYTVDLSDPVAPRVAGELELLGYSAYLHPAGKGRLIGVGQDASAAGRLQGAQISVFDVADPAHPALLQRASLGPDSSTAAEWDHHAFLFWPRTDLVVLPAFADGFSGAIGLTVRGDGIRELGRVAHPGDPPVERAVVIGQRLFTVSRAGVEASGLDTLAGIAFAPFG